MSLPTPLLSVIVPVYNVAPYLEQCLDSILSQSYSALEVIVVMMALPMVVGRSVIPMPSVMLVFASSIRRMLDSPQRAMQPWT